MRKLILSFALSLVSGSWLAGQELVRIPEGDFMSFVATRVEPQYPPMAKQARVSGVVRLDVTLTPDGRVEKVDVINGNLLLSAAAVNAVKEWRFKPPQVNGKNVRAVGSVGIGFRL